jgi:glutamine cyclotransferase
LAIVSCHSGRIRDDALTFKTNHRLRNFSGKLETANKLIASTPVQCSKTERIDCRSRLGGTGRYGKSSIRIVDLSTGRVLQRYDIAAKYFGEGLTSWGNDLVQLTWKAELGFVYSRSSLAWKQTFHYEGEGWGLTHDDQQLILSDGTPVLRFLNPQSFFGD